jgi:hypothetical protein
LVEQLFNNPARVICLGFVISAYHPDRIQRQVLYLRNIIILLKTDLSSDGSYRKDLKESFEYDGLNRLRYARLYQADSQAAI